MDSRSPVEIADQFSRRRVTLIAVATLVFLGIQVIAGPFWGVSRGTPYIAQLGWAINAFALLLMLAIGSGLLRNRRVRALVDDEVSRHNREMGIIAGYWLAMATAMGLYVATAFRTFTAREALYLVVTPSVGVALLTFCYLEWRAHRDA
ncbi:MAG TPA: hypothetical protein VKB91_07450 [Gemmatimonadaceae bacterium]|nr:hypothetical protein [Gemmatimonadaceae bacterium]